MDDSENPRDLESKKTTANKPHQPNSREINRLLKNLAKDRQNPAPPQPRLNEDQDDENAENPGSNCGGENNDGLDRSADDNGGDDHNVDDNSGGGANCASAKLSMPRIKGFRHISRLMYYNKFERQLHIFAIRYQLHVALLYMHIGQINQMRGPTTYNNFCRFDPKARGILSTKEEPLKAEYKDAAYIETIRGDIPMLVTANGSIQTARKTHVAKATLNLASNQSSITFVKRWAKDTIKRMNEIAACHRIQGF
ncbi:hypothetical protein MJO28_016156 [Puccinia striiformis f. sp. tritici]|uniref:Uncharacterized protein n=1 Tax=Puccinia striiformis f. sp. tritici TaxID=168172 RepID=A0ACC0DRU9_9BASI|nr:hypothetical protein Pst134EB_029528 [Puccinia striiformis f. sp. tritici]KAI7937257.1 hypothetical protein MJO28_016156 [Puccinia striiformis f. sp. tritici]KAI9624656.1 hypothetical protein H4Q26_016720 [Puccinia striiformis f. sp. tritici PST-130]